MIKAGNMKLGEFEVDVFIDFELYRYDLYLNGKHMSCRVALKTVADMFDSILTDMRETK